MVKGILKKSYHVFLKKRWHMKSMGGASLLGGVFAQDYRKHKNHLFEVYSIHRRGFTWDDWHVDGLTKENCAGYLKSAEYYAMHPLNGSYSHWIDDKLTLKYLCAGTKLDRYLPKYYYQIDGNGNVLALSDAPNPGNSDVSEIIALLESIGELAIKRVAGSLGEGFYKASFKNGKYSLNSTEYTRDALRDRLSKLKDYLITEYLHPHQDMVPFSADTVNTIRYLIGRNTSGKMELIKTYVRFGTEASGFVENYGAGGVLCFISNDGKFTSGNMLNLDTMQNLQLQNHPDTGIELKGTIPLWAEIQEAAEAFGTYFPQMNYLGLDFVATNRNEVKILEINSLTSLDTLQLEGSILQAFPAFYGRQLRRKRTAAV